MRPRGNSCTAAPGSGSAPPLDVASFDRFGAEAATFTPGPAGGAASIGGGACDLWNGRIAAGTIGIGAGVLGMASDAGLIKAGVNAIFGLNVANKQSRAIEDGMFSILDWSKYPLGPRSEGPFKLLSGEEYVAAVAARKATNDALHRWNFGWSGLHIHGIQPIKFDGSPTAWSNKMILTPAQHYAYNAWRANRQRSLK